MNKIKEFVTKNKLYVGIGAAVTVLVLAVVIVLLSGGSDKDEQADTTTASETVETTTVVPETTTEEPTTEAPTESTTVEETTTTAPETTTEEPTTTVPETTTKAPETTTKKQSSSSNKGEEVTESVNDYGNGFYGYNSERYKVLSTEFETLNPEWVEVPEMEQVFDFVIKNNITSYDTWEYWMNKPNGHVLYPELKSDIDNLCLAWTKGEATIEDIDNRCIQNVCYTPLHKKYIWMWTYTVMDTDSELRTAARPTHFVINNYVDYFVDELQKSREVWDSYFEDKTSPDYCEGASDASNIPHYLGIDNMLRDGFAGGIHFNEYYYLKVYLDKKTDKLHVYFVPFFTAYEDITTPFTEEQIAEFAKLPLNKHYKEDYHMLKNLPEHDCKLTKEPKW